MDRIRELMRDRRAQRIAAVAGAGLLLVIAGVLAFAVLSRPDETAEVSPTPSPSLSPLVSPEPTASESPAPSPSDPDESAAPTPVPTPTPSPPPMALDRPFAATVLVNNLRVREQPGDGAPIGSLGAGEIVLLYGDHDEIDGIDWYGMTASGGDQALFGWASAGPDGDPYLELHYRLAHMRPATIEGLAGGDAGYLAWGHDPSESTEQPARFVAVSADGARWQSTEAPGAVRTSLTVLAAHGPAGWLLVTANDQGNGPGELWRSADGLAWQENPLRLPDNVVPNALAGNADGYALAAVDYRSEPSQAALFVSDDGARWTELTGDPFPYAFDLHARDDGFVLWGETANERFVVRTANAGDWTSGEDRGLPGIAPRVASVGDSIVAVATAPGFGPTHAWRSSLPLGTWERQPQLEAILADINVGHLVATDDWMLLAGREYRNGAEQWWRSSNGRAWEQVSPSGLGLNDVLGPMAAGAGGLAAVAVERTDAGSNPTVVRSADGLNWTAATEPAAPVIASAVIGACPAAPETMLEWMAIPGSVGAECFGSSPITVTAWSTRGGGCGGLVFGRFEPSWLAHPFAQFALVLTPMEISAGSCGEAAVAPGTEVPEPMRWVSVTGHWDDPAAANCRFIPQRDFPWARTAGVDLLTECRSKFVATSVTPTSAP
jgi:hypothetical protein